MSLYRSHLPARFNLAQALTQAQPAAGRGNQTYMVCGEQRLTFQGLAEQTARMAGALEALGVRPGERVMLLTGENLRFPPLFLGVIHRGAVAVPLNPLLTPQDHLGMLHDSQASLLVVEDNLWPLLARARLPAGLKVALTGQGSESLETGLPRLETLAASQPAERAPEGCGPDAPAFWLYTSGSTGVPKAAIHRHRDMMAAWELYGRGVLNLRPGEVTFSAPKFFFAYGLGNSLAFPLLAGATAVISGQPPTPRALLETLARHRPAVFYAVPTHLNGLLNLYQAWREGREDPPAVLPTLDHLRLAVSAGETLPAPLWHRWKAHFSADLLDGLGTTELFHIVISNRPGASRPGTTGTLVEGVEARLARLPDPSAAEQDNPPTVVELPEAAPGETGLLLVRSEAASPAYWNRPELSQAVMAQGWTVTGDLFQRSAEGWFTYVGRNDDMMKVGGSWVAPAEVEAALMTHPAVAECAVAGAATPDGLGQAKAFVVLNGNYAPEDSLAEELKAHMAQQMAAFKVPRWVAFVHHLPKTATGKIQRYKLRG
ncbi:MAG: benzoate-CoA ligase family protein [Deltaproteobacteria bacterium]|nr:benzoate-CoA ligase family protein [Deltaproteobacteria bacterium]MDH4122007.1 benzoate-CoA ligase family protein [Deltaproteobacteria bacterium]